VRHRGFWREFLSRNNAVVDSMVVLSVILCGPIVALSCASLIYDIWWKDRGLTDVSVKLLVALISAGAGGLAVSRFSKRTDFEMSGLPPRRVKPLPPPEAKNE
jgi:hypothetical protein